MTGAGVELVGAERFARTTAAAARRLDALDHGPAVTIMVNAAAGYAPKRTGRLSGSIRAFPREGDAAPLGSTLPYAGAIHNGWPAHGITAQPFVTRAVDATEPAWLAAYVRTVESVLDTVEGA